MLTPEPFDLALTVRSHGFYDLPPWRWDPDRCVLARPLALATGRVVDAEVAEGERGLAFRVLARGRPSTAEAREARELLRTCLALDEELAAFRARAGALEAERAAGTRRDLPDLRWALARGAGRLLRSPTVFEDAVKTLCTTNCSWALTRAMVSRLCERLGEPSPSGARTFPGPAAMARVPASFYRDEVRAGYRAPYLAALAAEVASGALDLEALRTSGEPAAEVLRRLRGIRGFGPYAAEHLLRLLGRHDHLALDSWTRAKVARLRGRRRAPTDRALRRWYAPYGAWAGLAMWLEVTADWHGESGSRSPRPQRGPPIPSPGRRARASSGGAPAGASSSAATSPPAQAGRVRRGRPGAVGRAPGPPGRDPAARGRGTSRGRRSR